MTDFSFDHALELQAQVQREGINADLAPISRATTMLAYGMRTLYLPTEDSRAAIPGIQFLGLNLHAADMAINMLWLPSTHAEILRRLNKMGQDLTQRKLRWGNAEDLGRLIVSD